MKIEQEKKFNPITIMLETEEEAIAFIKGIDLYLMHIKIPESYSTGIFGKISSEFTNKKLV